jgi:hypothetical protein
VTQRVGHSSLCASITSRKSKYTIGFEPMIWCGVPRHESSVIVEIADVAVAVAMGRRGQAKNEQSGVINRAVCGYLYPTAASPAYSALLEDEETQS